VALKTCNTRIGKLKAIRDRIQPLTEEDLPKIAEVEKLAKSKEFLDAHFKYLEADAELGAVIRRYSDALRTEGVAQLFTDL
jgi:hypothetical protein